MGSAVTAKCTCGVNTIVMIGGGIANLMTTCLFPCQCVACHDVVEVNLMAKKKRCPKCGSTKIIPYDDPTLSDVPGGLIVAEWSMKDQLGRVLKLTDGNYRCAKCEKMTLRFADHGLCWD